MEGYKAQVTDTIGDFSKRDRIRCKQQADCYQIKDMFGNEDNVFIEHVIGMATVHVTNENSKNKEYDIYTLKTADGELYSTSSDSLARSFEEVAEETILSGDPEVDIKIIRKESNNKEANGGKFFTCTIL